ncbi:MAG: TetR/AcrR family transcriptional regulator [Desulfuromonadales bacterium]|nr:TetR/AcrR family transcriptional regulator [Desulfuromonadales bacterium]NIR33679.1 TetR/AcrR family transcriptional regulator [Desulfuromonadales bacterium]NIS44001.1 TetR/AcrR family transcriptional regulator [Desulfuromonadales bacterium]
MRTESTEMRDRILKTALHLFSTRGYFNTSVHDIRREADVSIGAIYHYFKGKETIADALYRDLLGWLEGEIREVLKRHDTAHDRCLAAVAHLFAMTEAQPEAMSFVLGARHREFLPDQPPICSSRPFEMMKEMVSEGMRKGELRTMDETVATAVLFGGPLRLIQLRLDGVIERSLPEELETAWPCAWRSVSP